MMASRTPCREPGSEDMVNASELLINAVIDDKPLGDTNGLDQKGAEEGCPARLTGHADGKPLGEKAGPNSSIVAHAEHGKPVPSPANSRAGRPKGRLLRCG